LTSKAASRRRLNPGDRLAGTAIAVTVGAVVPLTAEAAVAIGPLDASVPAMNPRQAEISSFGRLAAVEVMQTAAYGPDGRVQVNFSRNSVVSAKLPELEARVAELRSQMEQFQAAYTAQNLETHQAILTNRTAEIAQQKIEIGQQISEVESQLVQTQTLLALQPYEASFADQLLADNSAYQQSLQTLRVIDQQIAMEFSFPDLNEAKLRELYDSYHQVADVLRQEAQQVLAQYLNRAAVESPNPLWQEPMYRDLLQSLMDSTHQINILEIRQATILETEQLLQQRRAELSTLLRTYAGLQQQLEVQTRILQEYVVKRQTLEQAMAQPNVVAPAMKSPQMATTTPSLTPWLMTTKLPREWQEEILLALLASGVLLTAWSRRERQEPRYKDYQLLLSAIPEPAFLAPIDLPVQNRLNHALSVLEPPSELHGQPLLNAPKIEEISRPRQLPQPPHSLDMASDEGNSSQPSQNMDLFATLAFALTLQAFSQSQLDQSPSEHRIEESEHGSENSNLIEPETVPLGLVPVTLPMDDIDLFADEAITTLLSQFSFEDEIDENLVDDSKVRELPVSVSMQVFSKLLAIV
jgi:hypothetical protein